MGGFDFINWFMLATSRRTSKHTLSQVSRFESLPGVGKEDVDKFSAWWSDTGKPQPEEPNIEEAVQCVALHIQPDGYLFYREPGRYRVCYFGAWKLNPDDRSSLLYYFDFRSDLVIGNCNLFGEIHILPSGEAELSGDVKTKPIPPVQ